ncbi:hypothetical protein [Actinomadura sp. NPDC048394]|jgi:hypothetical protein|uniref:hypothetical protein n=1 Tax=Actinomadura sp. NPDC048394 TaxID=3158223 RepID=UPI0033D2E905
MSDGLSCYTGNLVAYLERHETDPAGRVARSIRVAVRTDLPDGSLAISHHAMPLHRLPDGGELRYRSARDRDATLHGIRAELDAQGQVLVVADSSLLPWSPGADTGAPHYLLVTGFDDGGWHVVDRFSALLPGGGEQRPFDGRLGEEEFAGLLRPRDPLPPEQRRRNEHAFGFPVPVPPDGDHQWLARVTGESGDGAVLPGRWITDPARALDRLAEHFASGPDSGRLLEDVWAVARHHTFRYERLRDRLDGADEAYSAWNELPRAVRFAHESAQRGRARPSLIATAFGRLSRIEDDLREPLAARGYGVEMEGAKT